MTDHKQTKIWKRLKNLPDHEDFLFVDKMVEDCIPILREFSKTFPRYTDHSGIHQVNILNLMAELLGDRLDDLTSLECAILILATYLHDIGMAYTEAEGDNLSNDERFPQFLNENAKANRIFQQNEKKVIPELAEWYCRWNHAFRVHKYLLKFEREKSDCLRYKGISLRSIIGLVCESHNWTTTQIKNNEEFITDFFSGKADLVFCAILLRLADYLDFDDSRASRSLFNFLELNNPKDYNEKISQREWLKHQASAGFIFPTTTRRTVYEVRYLASPNEITIEQEIRDFLKTIEKEFEDCSKLLRKCSKRWDDFNLPDGIKAEIYSQGYTYGDFKFNLDQEQILNLLMGENLYDDPFIFIRELLQNALDTSRHREFDEWSRKNVHFKVEPISVSNWEDEDGYRWIRIDDSGMGMNEKLIKSFLLNVGTSYYNSDEFKVEQLNYETQGFDFTPISRFGIGILSCFIIGDKIEINTYKLGYKPIRLSVNGIHKYFVLQTGLDIPNPMPHKKCQDEGYRTDFGTSIAVRLNPAKETKRLKLKETLEQWLFCPPVPVQYEGMNVGGIIDDLNKPFCEERTEYLTTEQLKEAEEFLGMKFPNGLGMTLMPYDITNHSYDKKSLKGQGIILCLTNDHDDSDYIEAVIHSDDFVYRKSQSKIGIELLKSVEEGKSKRMVTKTKRFDLIELSNYFNELGLKVRNENNSFLLTHDGIIIQSVSISRRYYNKDKIIFIGVISLFDKLRPEVSTSRNKVTKLSWAIDSQINFALYEYSKLITKANGSGLIRYNYTPEFKQGDFTVGELSKDILFQKKEGWLSKDLFTNRTGRFKFLDIKKVFEEKKKSSWHEHDHRVSSYLKHKSNIALEFDSKMETGPIWVLDKNDWSEDKNLDIFTPLFFIPFINSSLFMFNGYRNLNHPFSQWFIHSGRYLKKNYPAMFENFIFYTTDIFRYPNGLVSEEINPIIEINQILNRIRMLRTFPEDFRPADNLGLKKEDILVKGY